MGQLTKEPRGELQTAISNTQLMGKRSDRKKCPSLPCWAAITRGFVSTEHRGLLILELEGKITTAQKRLRTQLD